MNTEGPEISVVVPVRNDPVHLDRCLAALALSDLEDFEVIVVDDASTDETPEVARRYGTTIVRQERRTGPGVARNTGVDSAISPLILFVDADVVVAPDTLSRVVTLFANDHDLGAVFGSYDDRPTAPNFISQYRNLLHRFYHQMGAGEASTFWAGCGAIRRQAFEDLGGFNAKFDRPSIEDIELGARLNRKGGRIHLHPEIEVTHLKEWRFWPMLMCDVAKRGIPWTLEVLRSGSIPNTLNLRFSQRVSAALAGLLALVWAAACWVQPIVITLPLIVFGGIISLDRLAPQGVGHWFGAMLSAILATGVATFLAILARTSTILSWWLAASAVLVGLIVLVNRPLYGFFLQTRGLLFTLLVLPMHIFYYLYSIAAFMTAQVIFRVQTQVRSTP